MRKYTCALFVYGTLKRGFGNHYLLENSFYLSDKSLFGFDMVQLTHAHFPIIIPDGKGEVHGEVFLIDEETLFNTDRLEGHPDMYLRVKVGLINHDGIEYELFVYLMPRDQLGEQNLKIISSGTFTK